MDGTSLLPSSTVGSSFKRSYHCVACTNFSANPLPHVVSRFHINFQVSGPLSNSHRRGPSYRLPICWSLLSRSFLPFLLLTSSHLLTSPPHFNPPHSPPAGRSSPSTSPLTLLRPRPAPILAPLHTPPSLASYQRLELTRVSAHQTVLALLKARRRRTPGKKMRRATRRTRRT